MTKGKVRTNQFALSEPISYQDGVGATGDEEAPSLGQVQVLTDQVAPVLDVLTAQVGGGVQDFTTSQEYKAGSLEVFVAGPRLREDQFSETGADTFHTAVAPGDLDFLVARYMLPGTVETGEIRSSEVTHTEGEVRVSALKSDNAVMILDTSVQAADYYLPVLAVEDDGFHLRIVRQGQFTATVHAPDDIVIEDNPTYAMTEDGAAIEVIYTHHQNRWVVITTGLHVIEHYPPANAAAYHLPPSPTGEISFAPPPPPVTTEGKSYDKTFVIPTEGRLPISPPVMPYAVETARVESSDYPWEGSAGISPPVMPYAVETATLDPLNEFLEEPEVP